MYCLYLTMKEQSSGEISAEEIEVALGHKVLDQEAAAAFIDTMASTKENIQCTFERQVKAAAVSQLTMFISM